MKRLLVADDSEDNRKVLAFRLRRLGEFIVDEAANGLEAVRAVEAHPPDLVFMDLDMPIMDGLQATRTIRRSPNASAAGVPIIAVTAACLPGDRERCVAAGTSDYIAKPVVDPDALRSTVTRWLASTR